MENIQLSLNTVHKQTDGMVGLFFEDINFAADGGLYAEMIENRSFEAKDAWGNPGSFYTVDDPGYAWSAWPEETCANVDPPVLRFVTGDAVSEANPHYLRFTSHAPGQGFANKAYDGLCLKKGMTYHISFYARVITRGNYTAKVLVEKDGTEYGSASVALKSTYAHLPFIDLHDDVMAEMMKSPGIAAMASGREQAFENNGELPACNWVRYAMDLTATEDVRGAKFVLIPDGAGIFDFDFISMIPEDAAAGIFRRDLFEALEALHPGFIRFPGGCIVEGTSLANRYQWKHTVGRMEDRKIIPNLWAYDDDRAKGPESHRDHDSHYSQSYGLGFYEFFLLCEMLGARPLPVLNVGLACQFRSHELVPVDSPEFMEYIQDALALIEFANGPQDTLWGGLRAQMGHPEPFNMDMIGIGNEQWETKRVDFKERAHRFESAIHEIYPSMKIIGSAGPIIGMAIWKDLWDFYRSENGGDTYAVDEHYYLPPEWFLANAGLYDDYPREVGVFAGEYAAHNKDKENTMDAAVAEAAFLTGLEKNADVIKLASYAPLFNRIGHSQWKPDLIWFDDHQVYLTPSYYVQLLFSVHAGEYALDMQGQEKNLREKGLYISVTGNTNGTHTAENEDPEITEMIIKLVNTGKDAAAVSLHLPEAFRTSAEAHRWTLLGTGEQPQGYPERTVLEEDAVTAEEITIEGQTMQVIRISLL